MAGIQDIKEIITKSKYPQAAETLKEIFTCLICKQITEESSRPLVPPCCGSIVCCHDCLRQWLSNSPVCPHCRSTLVIEDCQPQPILRPMFNILKETCIIYLFDRSRYG